MDYNYFLLKSGNGDTMKELTSYGVKDPVALMEAFHEIGQNAIINIVETSAAPENRKQLRTWGINAVAQMVGKAPNTIRSLEEKGAISPPIKDSNGRKQYTLEIINQIRDLTNTRFTRPESSEPIICSVMNFKGGVGKSMTSLLLLQYLAINGLKVLGVDLDSQATLTTWFGFIPDIDLNEDDTLATTLLEDENDITRVIRKTYFTGIDLVPANLELQNAELILPSLSDDKIKELGSPLKRLKLALEKIKNNYDVIIIDCPPNTGALTMNAVSAINSALITLPPSMPDFASFIRLTKTLQRVFKAVKPEELNFFRILLTKHKGNAAANKLDQLMRKLYAEYILVNHMVDSAEIDNTANALLSLYEKPYATNSSTYRRALEACNKVNLEIFDAFKEIWER
ncbi:MAG: chromosome partitioning protein ParA [Legionellales bacterium]|nr:chromosome partitioning protein ParA [Legionellales bacterium]|tara:strand:+ start:3492 stop:4688 length:1197 start_codon:yes stop_codon:yes gene_type:complete